jgi:competence protein ComEA
LRWLNAISILTLILSIGTLVITAAGTGSVKTGDDSQPSLPPSSPVLIGPDGAETAPLSDILSAGEVGVMLFGEAPDSSVSTKSTPSTKSPASTKSSVSTKSSSSKKSDPSSKKAKPSVSKAHESVSTECININTASEAALTALKGIGPSAAAKIVEYRVNTGSFKKKEDLMKVKGIGPAKFAAIEPFICL